RKKTAKAGRPEQETRDRSRDYQERGVAAKGDESGDVQLDGQEAEQRSDRCTRRPLPVRRPARAPHITKSGASTSVIVESILMRTWSEGPAVSLKGSPTVSPTTAALWASDFFPTTTPSTLNSPDSMYFFALSQAPPALFRNIAIRMPVMVPTMSIAATASAPIWPEAGRKRKLKPTATGAS